MVFPKFKSCNNIGQNLVNGRTRSIFSRGTGCIVWVAVNVVPPTLDRLGDGSQLGSINTFDSKRRLEFYEIFFSVSAEIEKKNRNRKL